jgi:hypothetical protein
LWITQVAMILPGILAPTKLYDGLAASTRSSIITRHFTAWSPVADKAGA